MYIKRCPVRSESQSSAFIVITWMVSSKKLWILFWSHAIQHPMIFLQLYVEILLMQDALYDHHVRRSMQYKTANDFEWAASTVHSSTNSSVNTQSHIWCWSSGSPGSSTPPPWKNYSQPSGQMPQSSWIQPADVLFTQRPWNECMDCFQGFCLPYVTNTLKCLLPLKY